MLTSCTYRHGKMEWCIHCIHFLLMDGIAMNGGCQQMKVTSHVLLGK